MVLRPTANFLLKLCLTLLLAGVLYRQVAEQPLPDGGLMGEEADLLRRVFRFLLPTCLLVPVNLWLEARKWQLLQRPVHAMGGRMALWGVLAGTTLAVLTPGRIGEFGGRAMVAEDGTESVAVVSTAIGGMAQWLAMLAGGIPGLLVYGLDRGYLSTAVVWPSVVIGMLLFSGLCWAYFKLGWIVGLLLRWEFRWPVFRLASASLRRLIPLLRDSRYRLRVLWLSFLRYATYTVQYVLLLAFVGIWPGWRAAFSGVTSIFLIQSGLPLPPVMGLMARGEMAILAWEPYGAAPVAILAATFMLFLLNLGIPAVLGWWWMAQADIWGKMTRWWPKALFSSRKR